MHHICVVCICVHMSVHVFICVWKTERNFERKRTKTHSCRTGYKVIFRKNVNAYLYHAFLRSIALIMRKLL